MLYGFLREYEIISDEDFFEAVNEGRICNLIRINSKLSLNRVEAFYDIALYCIQGDCISP